ncbi:hypothetical protein WAI453_011891 [Rhynchosporium graminicola]
MWMEMEMETEIQMQMQMQMQPAHRIDSIVGWTERALLDRPVGALAKTLRPPVLQRHRLRSRRDSIQSSCHCLIEPLPHARSLSLITALNKYNPDPNSARLIK